jgi:hypothetical protein
MALSDLIKNADSQKKIGLSEERVMAIIPQLREYVSFWREYPDMFVDFMAGPDGGPRHFKLYFYQRLFLRAALRHKYMYAVFPRAYSKSFLAMLILMIRCILYPGAQLFVTAGGKAQAAGIIKEKVQEICRLIPAFEREIDYGKGKTMFSKDKTIICFKNGSSFDNLAANEKTRGSRRHGGCVEECVGVDGDILQQVIIPVMNVSRLCADGSKNNEETTNKFQLYITTAGYKNTFAYDKLISVLVGQIIKPEKYAVMGGSWKIPVMAELLDKNFITDLKAEGLFNEASFDREYNSRWTGVGEDSFFTENMIDKNRKLLQPEYEYSGRTGKSSYYILSADIGRKGCKTVVAVLKVLPQPQGPAIKNLVNLYTYEDMHIEDQIIEFKRLFYKYKARAFVIDGNGIGINYVDLMIKSQIDPETQEQYPDFGVINDPDGYYKKYKTAMTEQDAMFVMKAHAPENTEAHATLQNNLASGKLRLLIDEKAARAKLLSTKVGQEMTPERRAEYLRPFVRTDVFKEELLNLKEENEGINIILKQANRGIPKDTFSAVEYGLYYIKQIEDTRKRKKRFNVKDFLLMN